ncbi:hypothetical protein SAVCW2_41900 [Streptomyces avermitilis]|uniref:Uncharacterized protein n=1 Tax=Streptomyces avermitilis TaxID=33903 RepID=A0A4D4MYA0_STRAX|nr:hypothetical protein SAV31267_055220 [Streptomyces avermitilis]GDY84991.1 hypothetical protein SAVCW2_41900 [Streptomyces avermitilis]
MTGALGECGSRFGVGSYRGIRSRAGTPESDGGAQCRARGEQCRAASRPFFPRPPPPAYRIATGATGVPVPPTNGSGIADSRKQ